MTRSDLVEQISIEKSITYAVAEKLVLEIFGSMADTLIAGDRMGISD